MTLAQPPSATDRFALLLAALCGAVAAQGGRQRPPPGAPGAAGAARVRAWLTAPLVVLLWTRLRRIAARFASVAARVQAARPLAGQRRPAGRPNTALAPSSGLGPDPAWARSARPAPGGTPRLPARFGWLLRLMPEAAGYRGQLQHLLADREIAALLATAPHLARALRPLCRMLGVDPAPHLPPPARRRRRPASPASGKREVSAGPDLSRRPDLISAPDPLHAPNPWHAPDLLRELGPAAGPPTDTAVTRRTRRTRRTGGLPPVMFPARSRAAPG